MTTYGNQKRRTLLQGLLVSGALTAPHSWTKPIVNVVNLPAHAATSGCSGTFCLSRIPPPQGSGSTITGDRIVILLDESGQCSFIQFDSDDDPETNGNRILSLDLDSPIEFVPENNGFVLVCESENFDVKGSGDSNWNVSHSLAEDDNPPGTYPIMATRLTEPGQGSSFQLTLDIGVQPKSFFEGSPECGESVPNDDGSTYYTQCYTIGIGIESQS